MAVRDVVVIWWSTHGNDLTSDFTVSLEESASKSRMAGRPRPTVKASRTSGSPRKSGPGLGRVENRSAKVDSNEYLIYSPQRRPL
jgi:hypothetical protein